MRLLAKLPRGLQKKRKCLPKGKRLSIQIHHQQLRLTLLHSKAVRTLLFLIMLSSPPLLWTSTFFVLFFCFLFWFFFLKIYFNLFIYRKRISHSVMYSPCFCKEKFYNSMKSLSSYLMKISIPSRQVLLFYLFFLSIIHLVNYLISIMATFECIEMTCKSPNIVNWHKTILVYSQIPKQ